MPWSGSLPGRTVGYSPSNKIRASGMAVPLGTVTTKPSTADRSSQRGNRSLLFLGMHVFRSWVRQGASQSPDRSCCKRHKGNWGCDDRSKSPSVEGKLVKKSRTRKRLPATHPKRMSSGRKSVGVGELFKRAEVSLSLTKTSEISAVNAQLSARQERRRRWFDGKIWRFMRSDVRGEPRAKRNFFVKMAQFKREGKSSQIAFGRVWWLFAKKETDEKWGSRYDMTRALKQRLDFVKRVLCECGRRGERRFDNSGHWKYGGCSDLCFQCCKEKKVATPWKKRYRPSKITFSDYERYLWKEAGLPTNIQEEREELERRKLVEIRMKKERKQREYREKMEYLESVKDVVYERKVVPATFNPFSGRNVPERIIPDPREVTRSEYLSLVEALRAEWEVLERAEGKEMEESVSGLSDWMRVYEWDESESLKIDSTQSAGDNFDSLN